MVTLLGSILENAVCTVAVPTGGTTLDPETGNHYPNTRTLLVYLYFKDGSQPPKQLQESQPKDTPMSWVVGYVSRVVDPLSPTVTLPPAFPDTNLTRIPCTIDNAQIGSFYPIDRYENASLNKYVPLAVLGEQVWGWFDIDGEVEDFAS